MIGLLGGFHIALERFLECFHPRIGSWTVCRVGDDRCVARRDDE